MAVLPNFTRSGLLPNRADFERGGQLDQPCLVLVGVVLAEQEFGPGRKLRAYTCGGPTAIAAVSPGEFGTGERCVHVHLRNPSGMSTVSDVFGFGLVPRGFTGVSCLTLMSSCEGCRLAICTRPRAPWFTFAAPTTGVLRSRTGNTAPRLSAPAGLFTSRRLNRYICQPTGCTPAVPIWCCCASTSRRL